MAADLNTFTIAWNVLEGSVAIAAGLVARSISLLGYGIDSFIEAISCATLLWRMSVDAEAERSETNERVALRLVGLCFLGLAAYVACEALVISISATSPKHSIVGIILACASLVIMLSRAKRRVGSALASAAMEADAKQAEFCAYLSAILLGGLILNARFGLWWADPVAALIMVPIIGHEGVEGIRGEVCRPC